MYRTPQEHAEAYEAEKARAAFLAQREEAASRSGFWLTLGAVMGMGLLAAILLKPVSLFVISHFGAKACLFSWLAAGWAGVWVITWAVQRMGRPWERALHDRVTADLRVWRVAREIND